MLRSIAKLARNRGYAVREIVGHLRHLRPLPSTVEVGDEDSGTLEEMVRRMKRMPELFILVNGRDSLHETGHDPIREAEHTLKIPLIKTPSRDTEFLCFTRLGEEKWTCYRDRLPG